MKYILVTDTGCFASIEDAAFAEHKVDWLSSDTGAADACTISFGAWDIMHALSVKKRLTVSLCTKAAFSALAVDADTTVVFLGKNTVLWAAETLGFSVLPVESDGFDAYRIMGRVVNGLPVVCIYGEDRVSTLYGAYRYEEFHGLRFMTPGDDGTLYAMHLDRSGETVFDICEGASFRTRGAYGSNIIDTSVDFVLWASHMRLNYATIFKVHDIDRFQKLGIGRAAGQHNMIYEFMDPSHPYPYRHSLFAGKDDANKPADPYAVSPLYRGDADGDGVLTYGEAHPEWYPEVDGVRRLKRDYKAYATGYATGDYLCTSSEDGMNEYCRLIVDALADGAWKYVSYVDLWGLDNGVWCSCRECSKDRVLSYRQLMLAYRLDKLIKQAAKDGRINRKINIIVPAYHETLEAPDKPLPEDFDYSTISVVFFVIERCYLHNIDDPVCSETNANMIALLKAWTDGYYKGELFIGEYYNVSAFAAMPFVLKNRILNDIPYYYSIGARHFHYMHITARQWGVSAITNYLYPRLLWNISLDRDALVDEYFLLRYGKDAAGMRALYDEIEDICANCKLIKHYQYIHHVRTQLSGHILKDKAGFIDTLHMGLDDRSDDPQAGRSLREAMEDFAAAFDKYDALVAQEKGGYFAEDRIQLLYGREMLRFIYHMAKYNAVKDEPGDHSGLLAVIRESGEALRSMTAPLAGYDDSDSGLFDNGLTGSWMKAKYDEILPVDLGE